MAIKKGVYKVVFLYDDEIYPDKHIQENISVLGVLEEMNYGSMIGDSSIESIVDVPAEKVEDELLAIGNDGTFFDPIDCPRIPAILQSCSTTKNQP